VLGLQALPWPAALLQCGEVDLHRWEGVRGLQAQRDVRRDVLEILSVSPYRGENKAVFAHQGSNPVSARTPEHPRRFVGEIGRILEGNKHRSDRLVRSDEKYYQHCYVQVQVRGVGVRWSTHAITLAAAT
jgi:hypothetical protein